MPTENGSKRVVVVGGTGNISGALVDALVAAGHDVTVFVRGLRKRRLPQGVRVLVGDRNDRAAFERTMQEGAFDAAYDLICFTPEDAQSDVRAFEGVGHFVQTSTVCTFGGPLAELPATELTPLRPIGEYGRDKAAADEVFLDAHRNRGFPVTVCKPAHTWGPGMPLIRQLGFDPHWINRLREGKPLLIAGDGLTRWSMCHSDDLAQAYVGLLGQSWALGETYIVTGPEPVTWVEYHEQVADVLGVPLRLVQAPAEDILRCWPEVTELLLEMSQWDQCYDVTKLQTALPSFQPRLTLHDRAAENIAWMEEMTNPDFPSRDELPDREDEVMRELGV